MSMHEVEVSLSPEQLLKAVQQLSQPDFEQFFEKIVEMQSASIPADLSLTESELIAKMNQSILPAVQQRHRELMAKRRAQSITEREYDELLVLIDKVEKADAERIRCLRELAHLRKVSFDELIQQLGIKPQPYK